MITRDQVYRLKGPRTVFPVLVVSFCLLIVLSGYFYYTYEKRIIRDENLTKLQAITGLKIFQIEQWRNERLGDAHVLSEGHFIRENIDPYISRKDKTIGSGLRDRLNLMKYYHSYENIFFVSPAGELLFSLDTSFRSVDSVTINAVAKALNSNTTVFGEFSFDPVTKSVFLDVVSPVSENLKRPVAALVFRIDPDSYLFPLMQTWPTFSKSAETMLVRRKGDRVQIINKSRYSDSTALKLAIPLTQSEAPSVKAIHGKVGIFEGIDYRGKKVLAYINPIPGTPWFMISKVDESEIFAELNTRVIFLMLFALALIALFGTGISSIYNNRQKKIYRTLLEAQTELAESQQEFRTILYSIGDAVITTDLQGNIRNMNPVAENLTGWNESGAAGKPVEEVFNILDEESHLPAAGPVERVLNEGFVTGLANHTLLISKNGNELPIADSGAPIRNEQGEITGVVLVFRDQTAERNYDKALRESEDKFRYIFDNSVVGKSLTRPSGETNVNKAFLDMLGYDTTDFNEKKWQEISHPDDEELTQSQINSLVSGEKKSVRFIKRYLHRNGSVVWADVFSSLRRGEDGRPLYFITTVLDITERIHAEQELIELSRRQKAILEAVPDIIMEVDVNRIYTWANNSGFEFFGPDVIGKEVSYYFVNKQNTYELANPVFKGDENIAYIESWQKNRKGEERLLAWWCRSLKDRDGKVTGVLSSARDITERIKAEEEIRMLNSTLEQRVSERTAQLEASNKELEAFSYSVSHDLRAPLRHINGFVDLLRENLGDSISGNGQHYMEVISASANQMSELIDDLLQFSRTGRQEMQKAAFSMQILVSEVQKRIGEDNPGRDIDWITGELPLVVGDLALLRQVWINLYSNAVKFTRNRQTARIETGCRTDVNEFLFFVKDNGVGFDMKYASKLFGVFQRLHSGDDFEGTGIGLANVRRIIGRHGGRIWAEAGINTGATFYFTLPTHTGDKP